MGFNDVDWIYLAQDSAECSKWRTQGRIRSRDMQSV